MNGAPNREMNKHFGRDPEAHDAFRALQPGFETPQHLLGVSNGGVRSSIESPSHWVLFSLPKFPFGLVWSLFGALDHTSLFSPSQLFFPVVVLLLLLSLLSCCVLNKFIQKKSGLQRPEPHPNGAVESFAW